MPSCRVILALLLLSPIVLPPAQANSALAIVTSASYAQLGNAGVSAGTTLYNGDRLSTDVNGELSMRSKAFRAQFGSRTAVLLQDWPPELGAGTEIEMFTGRMDLSTAPAASITIRADGATFQPEEHNVTLATLEIHGPREVHIYVRRGKFNLKYRGATTLLEETKSYAILLDPTTDETALAEKLDPDGRKKPLAMKRPFMVILIAAAAGGVAIPELHHHHESPHNPGRGRH